MEDKDRPLRMESFPESMHSKLHEIEAEHGTPVMEATLALTAHMIAGFSVSLRVEQLLGKDYDEAYKLIKEEMLGLAMAIKMAIMNSGVDFATVYQLSDALAEEVLGIHQTQEEIPTWQH